jgi:hypothetical protein
MATLNSSKRNTTGYMENVDKAFARVLDFVVDLSTDATMAGATDDILLATLPAGAIVLSMQLQQVTAGTGTGTLVGRVGSTTLTGTLASTASASTWAAPLPAALPAVVAAGGQDVGVLGATAVRTDGKIRVVIVVADGDRSPREPGLVARDRN